MQKRGERDAKCCAGVRARARMSPALPAAVERRGTKDSA
jgi:hypothetical protein